MGENRFTEKKVCIVSAHMASGGGDALQVSELAKIINRIDNPVICGIDFNAKPGQGKTYGKDGENDISGLNYFMDHAELKTAHKEVVEKHLMSTWQRRCCGEQGEKIVSKTNDLKDHAKDIDHSFYRGFKPLAAMTLPVEDGKTEIERRWNKGGLPSAGNSSDHIYLCVEYEFDGDFKVKKREPKTEYKYTVVKIEKKKPKKKAKKPKKKQNADAKANKPAAGAKRAAKAEKDAAANKSDKEWYKKPTHVAAAVAGATALGAIASSPWWLLEEKSSISKTISDNKVATFIGSALVIPALCFGAYKLYQKYFAPKVEENDSECDSDDANVKCTSRSGKTGKKKKRSNKGEKPCSKRTIIIAIVVSLVILAAVYFLVFNETEETGSEYPEGDLPIGFDRV